MASGKTIEERVKDYAAIKKQAAERYAAFGTVASPALGGQRVSFTSEGFNHLVYKAPGKERDKRVQILRFDMLERAKFILETATTYQEYEEEVVYKKVNRRGSWVSTNVIIRRWGFVAIIRAFRVKVVVSQEGNGKISFYSVIPAWFTRQYRDIKLIETATTGGLRDEDDDQILQSATRG